MKLLWDLVCRDFMKNKVITAALAVFLGISALFMASGLRITGTMMSSLNGLGESAGMPDYLQMHKGSYDRQALERFARGNDLVKDALTVDMLNISNAGIVYRGVSFEKLLMDNGFVVQNEGFDFLLNMDNEIAHVADGEIGVPVYYAQALGIAPGDLMTLREGGYSKTLKVSTIIRDASMNPALTSSKRFLVSRADLDDISAHIGEWETLIEFRLREGASAAAFEKSYMDAGLPSNGVALTGSALKMMGALSFGVTALIIIAISILLIVIAILCLSYIIRATMAQEHDSIGEMKAIGFPDDEIRKLFQMKYLALVLVSAVGGYLAAIPLGGFFSSSVVLYCGEGSDKWMAWVFPLAGVKLLSLLVFFRCRGIIGRNLKSTVGQLMRGEGEKKKEGHYTFPALGLRHPNLRIALGELKCKWQEYAVIFLIFAASSFLILLPMNMKNTVENPSFMTYMGVGKSDIRIDLQSGPGFMAQRAEALARLDSDPQVTRYAVYQTGYVQYQNAQGNLEYLRVGNGDESVFPLAYLEGGAPTDPGQIALSYLAAHQTGKGTGDLLTVTYREKASPYTISGIYQDITYGGKTAKAAIDFAETDVEVYIIYLDVAKGVSASAKAEELRKAVPGGKVTPIGEFVSQTLGGIMDNLTLVERAAVIISLLLSILISAMFLQLITAREHGAIAIKKALGFTNRDIMCQLGIRLLTVLCLAVITGTLASNILGEAVFGLMLSAMGASKIKLLTEPFTAYFLCPAGQMLAVFITVAAASRTVTGFHIRNQIMQ